MTRQASTAPAAKAFRGLRLLGTVMVCGVVMLGAAACAPLPTEADERLDSDTGTTVTVMPRPVELILSKASGAKTDPFAYLAPFETNRMGSHEMYLWVSASPMGGAPGVPKVFCGEELIPLEVTQPDLKAMGLSRAPYNLPAPWSTQWYFKLSGEVLDCLARASRLKITTQSADAAPEDYIAEAAATSGISDFAARVRT